jgi:antitoxin component YwqK of YwqJK toxin-antitoxin module
MQSISIKFFQILAISFMLIPSSFAANTGNGEDLNVTDSSGLRQGYWIIKGYMTDNADYSPNSTVEEGEYKDGKKEGIWKKYWANNKVKSEITYINNRPQGAYSVYYKNGQLEERGIWDRSKNIGEFRRYYRNGKPQQEFYFSDNGKRNGIQRYFHENGQLELEVNIVNGKEGGVMNRYYADGSLKESKELTDGKLVEGSIRNYKANSHVAKIEKAIEKEEIELANENVPLPETIKAEDQPNEAFAFRPDGYNVLYDENQQVSQIGDFRNGRLWNGKWHRYNSNGILVRIEIYRGGKYIGTGVIQE